MNMNIPHASKELDKTTVAKGQTDDNVGLGDITRAHVDGRQHKRSQGESRQAQRSWVGELTALDGLVQTGLELTSERALVGLVGVDVRQRSVAKASCCARDFVFLRGHHGHCGRTAGSTSSFAVLRHGTNVLLDSRVFSRHFVVVVYIK